MSQVNRVLAALAMAGSRGITAVDFAAPNVIDGGKPIMRVAARIKELRDGGINVQTDGERNGCAVYVLVRDPGEVEPCSMGSASESEGGQLFDLPAQPTDTSPWRAA